MRAPNPRRPLPATSSSVFVVVLSLIVLSTVVLAVPASTRSVTRRHGIRTTDHGAVRLIPKSTADDEEPPVIGRREDLADRGISKRDHAEKDVSENDKSPLVEDPIAEKSTIGKSSVDSEFSSAKGVEDISKNAHEDGRRRFDAVVASEDAVEKNFGETVKSEIGNSEIGKNVMRSIIVRDAPIAFGVGPAEPETVSEVVKLAGFKVQRKRSLADPESAGGTVKSAEAEQGAPEATAESANDAREKIADSEESRPVLIPVASDRDNLEPAQNVDAKEALGVQVHEDVADVLTGVGSSIQERSETTVEDGTRAISESVQTHPKTIEPISDTHESAQNDEMVVLEPKTIVIYEDGIGEVVDKSEIGQDESSSVRKSLPIFNVNENHEQDDKRTVRSDMETEVGGTFSVPRNIDESTNKQEISKPAALNDTYMSSLFTVMKTDENLDALKAQAISLQQKINDKTYFHDLHDPTTEILPGMPNFTEIQLLDALKAIVPSEKSEQSAESSYLPKLNTSILNGNQFQILKLTETLMSREERPTFFENMIDCITSLSVLNCMKVFIWPIIADNLPESFTQNLPILPIEITPSDWLPENQQNIPKLTTSRSASSHHQKRLITPEVVVSGILKNALNADPTKAGDSLPTYIDSQNETLSKWLTPGQLEILKMAEKFLPESSRPEYSNRMSSCVRRFEYFSCIKYFAWPMVKQHYPSLPDFPDYQSWYPSVTLYPGYPLLPYPSGDGIGELPEVVEADAVRTRSPRPEAVIVQILENALRQTPGYLRYHAYQVRKPALALASISPEQMAIFYTAEQLLPVQLRAEYMAKTMNCIRDYDYLTCTKYSTWPTVRQWWSLPDLPDLSSFIPTFAVPELPDFSQYIPDFASLIPNFGGVPGTSQPQPAPAPQPEPQPTPDTPPIQEANVTVQSKEHYMRLGAESSIENRIIQILSSIRWIPLARAIQHVSSITPGSLAVLRTLSYNQLRILGLAKNALPEPVRGDLDSRFVGCLQGGSDFISCTRNVIWPTLQFYVKDMPSFPEEQPKPDMQKLSEGTHSLPALKPGVYQPVFNPTPDMELFLSKNSDQIAGRSPTSGQIAAEPEESAIPSVQPQPATPELLNRASPSLGFTAFLRQGVSAKSNDPTIPVISVTDTRFTPLYSDHPETVLLKILTTIQSSSKYADNSYAYEKPGSSEFLNLHLNPDQKNVIRTAESLLPEEMKSDFTERVRGCVGKSSFIVCSREIVWPTLAQYYQRLPSFPNFYINDSTEPAQNSETKKPAVSGIPAISKTDVQTGQHGDATVTITDTRFVPIFTQQPEAVILSILRNVQATLPNSLTQPGTTKSPTRTAEFMATFTDQQGNIVTVAENLLPESIREVFTKRMSECVKENSFLACTRDIAWPTIAQFFPRLPNFPNIGDLTDFVVEKPQQRPALLPPQLEPVKPSLAQEDPAIGMPIGNLVPIALDDVESRIEATLQQISARSDSAQQKFSFLNTNDPAIGSYLTERQANVIRLSEDILPYTVKPNFVNRMIDCARGGNVFPICVRDIGWPLLRQYAPNIPDLPDFGIFSPQLPQELPQVPHVQTILGYDGIQQGLQSFPFYGAPNTIGQASSISTPQQKSSPGGIFLSGIQGLTPSVESSASTGSGSSGASGLSTPRVPGLPSRPTGLLSDVPPEGRRRRRHIGDEPPAIDQDISSVNIEPQPGPNITDSEFVNILVNLTRLNVTDTEDPDRTFVNALNSTTLNALTTEQLAILKVVEDISSEAAKGVMSQVIQCIRSLSFIRCIGIFMWPVVSQNLPSLSTLGSFNPFGRAKDEKDSFQWIFGMTSTEFEEELLEKKKSVEKVLMDWYHQVVGKKYDNDFGFLRVQGYGDGEIGISFDGLERKGRGAKIKDSKHMPSILTIISDIMEDMLEQRDAKAEKKDHGKRDRSLREETDDYNRVSTEHDLDEDSERSTNDDQIIAMFIDKIKANSSDAAHSGKVDDNRYLSVEDAYEAFELLFGTRLTEKMAEKLRELDRNRYRIVSAENDSDVPKKLHETSVKSSEKFGSASRIAIEEKRNVENGGSDGTTKNKIDRSGLILRLPKMDEEFASRKITRSLVDLGRKMKMQMTQVAPGITFVISFFVQMALAHARAAASVAGMMSNMALGSAMLSMVRQWFVGAMNEPTVKHVYDNSAAGPGITWPHHNYHG